MKLLNFFLDQLVTMEDLNDLQANVDVMFASLIKDLGIQYAYSGMLPRPLDTPGMGITVGAGRCYFGLLGGQGQHGVLPSDQGVDLSHDSQSASTVVVGVGNQKWLSIFALPSVVNDTPIVTPAGPTVNYNTWGGVTFAIHQGVEGITPVRPDPTGTEPSGVLICDVLLTYGQTIVNTDSIDLTRVISYDADGHRNATLPYLVNTLNTITNINIPALYSALSGMSATLTTAFTSAVGAEATRAEGVEALKAALVHIHDASAIATGTIDPARLPILPSSVQIVSSGLLVDLTTGQEAEIGNGTIVITTDGNRYCYTGTGDKHLSASYIQLADLLPDWSAIQNKPTAFPPSAHNHIPADITGLTSFIAGLLIVPTGAVIPFAGSATPTGWLVCDGSSISRTTYAALFDTLGTVWGAGDGVTTFNLPDARSNMVMGRSDSHLLGSTGGEATHTLTANETPVHSHGIDGAWPFGNGLQEAVTASLAGGPFPITGNRAWNGGSPLADSTLNTTRPSPTTGGGAAHNNLPPFIAMNFIIKT